METSRHESAVAAMRFSQALRSGRQLGHVLPHDVGVVEIEFREFVRKGFVANVLRGRQRCAVRGHEP